MRKPCKSRACDNESQKGPSVYCSTDCKGQELRAVWHDRYVKEFGDQLTQNRFCICGDLLAQKPKEGTREFMHRSSCSRSCAAKTSNQTSAKKRITQADRKIATAMKRLRDNTKARKSTKEKQRSLGSYWRSWDDNTKLIHSALTGAKLC